MSHHAPVLTFFSVLSILLLGCATKNPETHDQRIGSDKAGVVVLLFTVSTEGRAEQIEVESSDLPESYQAQAVRTLKTWRWKPEMKNGVAVTTRMRMPMRFQLQK